MDDEGVITLKDKPRYRLNAGLYRAIRNPEDMYGLEFY